MKCITTLILVFATSALFAQTKQLADTIPFVLTAHNNISITAILNEADTLELMFHTAAGDISLTTEATARINSIEWSQASEVESWGGASEARFSADNTLSIGSHEWDNMGIWESQNSGPGTDGKFGPDLFEGAAIEINYDLRALIIHPKMPAVDGFTKVELKNENGFMFIPGSTFIEAQPLEQFFLIHSGYGGTILYDDQFVSANKLGDKVEIISEQELKDSYGNVLKTKKGLLEKFSLGRHEFTDIPIGFFEGSINRQKMSVIGGALLKRFNIIIDAERQNIYLQPSLLKDAPFSELK